MRRSQALKSDWYENRNPNKEEKTHGDPQRRKHQDSTSRQASGTTSAPGHQESGITLILPTVELPMGTTQATTVFPSAEDLQRTLFTTPHQTAPTVDNTVPPGAPNRDRGPNVETDVLALEGDAPEFTLSNFVSQNYEILTALMQEEARRRSSHGLQARLNFVLGHTLCKHTSIGMIEIR